MASFLAEQPYAELRANRETIDRAKQLLAETRKRLARSRSRADPKAHDVQVEARVLDILGSAYELPPNDVRDDVRQLELLGTVTDDFVAHLEHQHAWSPGMVVVYVGALRSAVLLGGVGPTPWDDL